MEDNKVYFRHFMLYYFQIEQIATQTQNKVSSVYEKDAVTD